MGGCVRNEAFSTVICPNVLFYFPLERDYLLLQLSWQQWRYSQEVLVAFPFGYQTIKAMNPKKLELARQSVCGTEEELVSQK